MNPGYSSIFNRLKQCCIVDIVQQELLCNLSRRHLEFEKVF